MKISFSRRTAIRILLIASSITVIGIGVMVSQYRPLQESPLFQKGSPTLIKEMIPPLGVIIENELFSRPFQVGLSEADIVYETLAEGGITRFFAVFPPEYSGEMGPVRSARPYFLDWAHEYKSIFAHVGGSSEALYRLRREKLFDADQFIYDKYFWRENVGKVALEHTMFTTGEKLRALIKEQGWVWERPDLSRFNRTGFKSNMSSETATNISIDFGFPTYRVQYQYDPSTNKYLRSQAKKPHIDHANQQQISPAAVVIQKVQSWSIGDSKGTIGIRTIGEGSVSVFESGRVTQGTWKKNSLEEPTRFFDQYGEEILFFPDGPLWIEVLPTTNSFSYN